MHCIIVISGNWHSEGGGGGLRGLLGLSPLPPVKKKDVTSHFCRAHRGGGRLRDPNCFGLYVLTNVLDWFMSNGSLQMKTFYVLLVIILPPPPPPPPLENSWVCHWLHFCCCCCWKQLLDQPLPKFHQKYCFFSLQHCCQFKDLLYFVLTNHTLKLSQHWTETNI